MKDGNSQRIQEMSKQWSIDNFQKTDYGVLDVRPEQGNGDWSINTFKYIVETKDRSDWAKNVTLFCTLALWDRKRWPDVASKHITADKRQDDVSFDCYIYATTCELWLWTHTVVWDVPLRLYSPERWAWLRAVRGKRNWYRFWKLFRSKNKDDYILELRRYMELALTFLNQQK